MFIHPLYIQTPPCIWTPSVLLTPPYVQTPPHVPNAPLCICMFCGYLHVIGGCMGPSCLDTPHVSGCLPMCPTSPHMYMLPCMSVCARDYYMHYGGNIPYVGGLGASAHLSGFWCLSVHQLDVHYASSCTFLVVHYV